ncbi:class I SAM-dependent methyltransferase [Roseiflexus castenholzii]|uniref:Modification methylase NspV n=1 Tax=Roseiflexus castenholzii (strain DSM 13941 / HLO8) TaxID=383372 RepID=A7NI75_ROSCS|nr:type I restriction-modification system subunit M [Roseiflexus castenholzii]ABU57175.1 modification methylase NspV [Roseiflexus castenholzii DSM 13941]
MRDQKQRKAEFGDFQTPIRLAREVCSLIARTGFRPASILEPTCGTGSFLKASLETFPDVSRVLGFEINPHHVLQAQYAVAPAFPHASIEVHQSDFFLTSWSEIVKALPEPILVIGNPPWVTNAALSTWGSSNVPMKSNLDNLPGIDALTGKSNFDISEWMLRKNIEWLNGKNGLLAMLCKTTVARKVLLYAWQNGLRIESASLYILDAREYFRASVDACLLVVRSNSTGNSKECQVFPSLHAQQPHSLFGLQDGMLVADVKSYLKRKDLTGTGFRGWRSGIKHDCSNVFELRIECGNLVNGLGEFVDIEPEVLFPLLKSSDLAAHRKPHRWMLVPQRAMSDDPSRLRLDAPKAWNYLTAHAHLLDERKSSIYRNRPRFSVFGVGPYSFAPWKIALSGLYKKLEFVQVPPFLERPVVFDDTCYFFPCQSEEECNLLYELVTSEPAREFWSAFIFWDAKRPITAQLLNSLDLMALARLLGKECDRVRTLAERQIVEYTEGVFQRLLFREETADYESDLVANELDLPAAQHALPADAASLLLRFAQGKASRRG